MTLLLCGLLAACAPVSPSQREQDATAEDLTALRRDCGETSVLALCDSSQCELFWCSAVAPYLEAEQLPGSPSSGWSSLPGSIGLHEGVSSRARSRSAIGREILRTSGSPQLGAPTAEGLRVFNGRDVIQQLVRLQKPGDVAAWWASEPKEHPALWRHPLSHWELEYLRAMASLTVPEALRMPPPVEAHFENRRRIVAHYVLTHPATIRLQLGLYGLVRDSNPLHFALERGWQVGCGKEMFTEKDTSRLGAAAEFFVALAVGVAVEKALNFAQPIAAREGTIPYLTPEVERAFVAAVRQRAAHMVEILSNEQRGPVLTGVLDTRTGRTFFGVNQEYPPTTLHPLLQQRLDDYLAATRGVTPPRIGRAGSHSEIVALNRALYEREAALGRLVKPHELSEFVLHNRSLRGTTKLEGVPPPCANCEAILPSETRVLP